MKLISALLLVLVLATGFTPTPGSMGSLTFKYSVTNIEPGYDHLSKLVVYEDGKIIGQSSEQVESKPNSVTVKLSKGNHNIRAVLGSKYEGNWEDHTVANGYSIDCLYDDQVVIKKKTTITLVFDIDKGTIIK